MQENKKKRFLIFYKDEKNIALKVYSDVFDVKDGLVTFETAYNKISVASSRILKVKDLGVQK